MNDSKKPSSKKNPEKGFVNTFTEPSSELNTQQEPVVTDEEWGGYNRFTDTGKAGSLK